MKVIILEDERHNSRLLHDMVKAARPWWEITGSFESVKETVRWLKNNPAPDLIFMDIQLTDGICFSIFKKVKVESMVIFTTAYDEYAIQAFEVNSIDYLLKPIKEERLLHAIIKFENFHHRLALGNEKFDYNELLETLQTGKKRFRKRFLVSGPTSYFKVDANDIAYFYIQDRATFIVLFSGEQHMLDLTVEKIEKQVDMETFFRVNRGCIININAIQRIENQFGGKLSVKLTPPILENVTVSRLKASSFKSWLDA